MSEYEYNFDVQCNEEPLSLYLLRKIFISALRRHWSDVNNHGPYREILGCLLWWPEGEDRPDCDGITQIFVGPAKVWDPKDPNKWPGIFVDIQGLTPAMPKTLIPRGSVSSDLSQEVDSQAVHTQLIIRCVHKTDEIAMAMAESCHVLMSALERWFLRNFPSQFLRLQFRGISDGNEVKEAPEQYFGVDLQEVLYFNHTVRITEESHRIKTFAQSLNVE
jgi:hypothetical protein